MTFREYSKRLDVITCCIDRLPQWRHYPSPFRRFLICGREESRGLQLFGSTASIQSRTPLLVLHPEHAGCVLAGKAWETPFGGFSPRLEGGAAASTGVAHAVVRLLLTSAMTTCLQ